MINANDFVNWARKHLHVPDLECEVGFLDDATYSSDESNETIYVAKVAYDNNYGNGAPPRPFFTNVVEGGNDYHKSFEGYMQQGYAVSLALEYVGTDIKQDIQRSIIDLKSPPNSPATIAKKGSSNPLVDTGHMGDSVTYKISGTIK